MKGRDFGFLLLGGIVAFILSMGLLAAVRPGRDRVPEVAGQQIPKTVHRIDFSKRYDLVVRGWGSERLVYRNCRIIGVTGNGDSSGGSRSDYGWDKWIVLELEDQRLAYIPPNSIFSIEQAAPARARQ